MPDTPNTPENSNIIHIINFNLDNPVPEKQKAIFSEAIKALFNHTMDEQLDCRKEEFEDTPPEHTVQYAIYILAHSFALLTALEEYSKTGEFVVDNIKECLIQYGLDKPKSANENEDKPSKE